MNTITISRKQKYKHLPFQHYEFVINSVIKFNAEHSASKCNIGKTDFINSLAASVGTPTSNIYAIIKDATVSVRSSNLEEYLELSASPVFQKRTKDHKIHNNSKIEKAKDFISLVIDEIKSNKLSSIDETVNYLKLHDPDKAKNMETVSTKTIYNYIHAAQIALKPIDMPRTTRRKIKKSWKTYISKKKAFLYLNVPNISTQKRNLVIGKVIW